MLDLYKAYPEKEKFFDYTQSREMNNISTLAGTAQFKQQVIAGKSAEEIRRTWETGLTRYKAMHKKNLLYP